ncbi:hypothetical protein GOODEAATRI_024996 [Goodea atripinnis]|uniref:Uncharacterized protein n=1 Tax=Goodea atripinnis TaxID=208336 RepID=A0ABV0P7L9_9TELE
MWMARLELLRTTMAQLEPLRTRMAWLEPLRTWMARLEPLRTWMARLEPLRTWMARLEPLRTWMAELKTTASGQTETRKPGGTPEIQGKGERRWSNPPGEKRRRRNNPQEMGQKHHGDGVVFGEMEREQSQVNAVEVKSCLAPGRLWLQTLGGRGY